MTYIPNPIPADGSVSTQKLGGDVTDVAKDLLKADTKAQQRAAIELPNILILENL